MLQACKSVNFINDDAIYSALQTGKEKSSREIENIIDKGRNAKGLEIEEVAALLQINGPYLD